MSTDASRRPYKPVSPEDRAAQMAEVKAMSDGGHLRPAAAVEPEDDSGADECCAGPSLKEQVEAHRKNR